MDNQRFQKKSLLGQFADQSQLFLNQNEYIQFGSSLPKQMLELLQMIDNGNKQINPKTLYQQIQGIINYYLKPQEYKLICLSQESIIETIKSITVFAGYFFSGLKSQYKIYGRQFYINFNQFQHIKFTNLKFLSLKRCNLYNIQPFSWLNMKSIKEIDMQNNHITSLKPFRKTHFKYLTYLKLSCNYLDSNDYYQFNQLTYLQRAHLPQLGFLMINQKKRKMEIGQYIQDLRILIKLQDKQGKRMDQKRLTVFFNSFNRNFDNSKAEIKIYCHSFLMLEAYEWEY